MGLFLSDEITHKFKKMTERVPLSVKIHLETRKLTMNALISDKNPQGQIFIQLWG